MLRRHSEQLAGVIAKAGAAARARQVRNASRQGYVVSRMAPIPRIVLGRTIGLLVMPLTERDRRCAGLCGLPRLGVVVGSSACGAGPRVRSVHQVPSKRDAAFPGWRVMLPVLCKRKRVGWCRLSATLEQAQLGPPKRDVFELLMTNARRAWSPHKKRSEPKAGLRACPASPCL